MRKRKIRALVGFPLGVFAGVCFMIADGIVNQTLSLEMLLNYVLAGSTGVLSVSIATMISDETDHLMKETIIHAGCTFVLVGGLFWCLVHMQTLTGAIVFLCGYFAVLGCIYLLLDYQTRKTVSVLNRLVKMKRG